MKNDDGLQRFCDININILNRHAPRRFCDININILNRHAPRGFCDININILNRHAPRKTKLARGNQISNAIYNKRSLKSNNEKIKTTQ